MAFTGRRLGIASLAVALAAGAYAFLVYRWWVPPAAVAFAAAGGYAASRLIERRRSWLAPVAAAGAILAAFAVLGPREGLF